MILTRFGVSPIDGGSLLMADIELGMEQSALYLEVTDAIRIQTFAQQFDFHWRNRGRLVKAEDLGIRISSGPEGSYTTGIVKTETSKK